jgi:hypothetical protein
MSSHLATREEEVDMKHFFSTRLVQLLVAISSLLLSAGVNPAEAQGHATYVAAIPFAFSVHDTVFPAGTYQITLLSQYALRLSVVGGTSGAYLMVFPDDDATKATTGQLRFTQYGDRYFLRQFSAPHEGSGWRAVSRLLPSAEETRVAKEWMARARASRGADVAVNSANRH